MSQMHYEWKLPSPIFGRMLLDVVMEMNISLVYRKDFAAWSLVSLCSSRYLSYSRCPLKGRPFAVTFIFFRGGGAGYWRGFPTNRSSKMWMFNTVCLTPGPFSSFIILCGQCWTENGRLVLHRWIGGIYVIAAPAATLTICPFIGIMVSYWIHT